MLSTAACSFVQVGNLFYYKRKQGCLRYRYIIVDCGQSTSIQ